MTRHRIQSGQVMVLVAVSLLALIGSAALLLLAGNAEWQKNQLQQLADQAALDSALQIMVGCDSIKAGTVITEADTFLLTQKTSFGAPTPLAGSCAAGYTRTYQFSGGNLSATINYPYRAHQQQVEVILTLTIPISFGTELGKSGTSLTRRAVAQQLSGSVPAVSATNLACTGGQVNIAGTVTAQNAVALSGSCALYAHARLDVASTTYSDLGNVSVYADGQAWSAAGTCVAAANAGSSNAICADGSELTGHLTPTCANGSTSFLSAGDAMTNPSPCAAGVARPPVQPLSTTLPPEPNTDAAAIASLQGNAGAACSAGGAYTTAIVLGGATVATGLPSTPIPLKDGAGFYHFKPSCYSYLNPGPLSGGISLVQKGLEAGPSRADIIVTLPGASTMGDLLVVTLRSDTSPSNKPFTAPSASWLSAATLANFQNGSAHTQIWYYPNNPGGIITADFGVSPNSIDGVGQMTEWSGVAAASPLDQAGTLTVPANQLTATLTTTGVTTSAGELAVTDIGALQQVAQTYTSGAGWTNTASDMSVEGYASEYQTNVASGIKPSELLTATMATTWTSVIATFKPAVAGGGSGAVLDPGFYYFNGSGLAGGGGICLNGGTLLAHDVTLEFVGQAGFSSGSCAVGGGAVGCTGPCHFGSPPCSIQACPPNTTADSPNNLTWFASPCSKAPAADASCTGSTWCPSGDRSCWNTLVWAPASMAGQIAIKGAAANHWLLGSISWPGTCTDTVNGTSTIAGSVSCTTLSISAGAGAATAIGSDYGTSTALVEAILVE